jgi:DNA invertase Pin-like site-specific DNA recombinase
LDRFARSLKHLVNALAEFEALGIAFVSLRDNLDLTPAGRLMFQIIGAMAEFERSLIQERVCTGLRNAKAKGVRLGRPTVGIMIVPTRMTIASALKSSDPVVTQKEKRTTPLLILKEMVSAVGIEPTTYCSAVKR